MNTNSKDDSLPTSETNEKTYELKWIDSLETPLNACSLEVFYNKNNYDKITSESSSSVDLPLVIGCYQLNESKKEKDNNNDNDNDCIKNEEEEEEEEVEEVDEDVKTKQAESTRSGELRLYMMKHPSILHHENNNDGEYKENNNQKSDKILFGKASQVVQMKNEGILDGKWYQRGHLSVPLSNEETEESRTFPVYAAACSSGFIRLYALNQHEQKLVHIASSSTNDDDETESNDAAALCLSLDWNQSIPPISNTHEIVSSYSDGTIATHKVHTSTNQENGILETNVQQTNKWLAHSMFSQPSEVWTTCFASNSNSQPPKEHTLILSGGDDCTMKLWDTRCLSIPISKIGDEEYTSGGVTTLSYHPKFEYMFASGSYDEIVRLWDVRYLTSSKKHVKPLTSVDVGGGVWRLKWHPLKDDALLVASMHGGCRVVNITYSDDGIEETEKKEEEDSASATASMTNFCEAIVVKEFKEHSSMAYGADWIYFPPPCEEEEVEVAASCSFYDRRAFLWSSV